MQLKARLFRWVPGSGGWGLGSGFGVRGSGLGVWGLGVGVGLGAWGQADVGEVVQARQMTSLTT